MRLNTTTSKLTTFTTNSSTKNQLTQHSFPMKTDCSLGQMFSQKQTFPIKTFEKFNASNQYMLKNKLRYQVLSGNNKFNLKVYK